MNEEMRVKISQAVRDLFEPLELWVNVMKVGKSFSVAYGPTFSSNPVVSVFNSLEDALDYYRAQRLIQDVEAIELWFEELDMNDLRNEVSGAGDYYGVPPYQDMFNALQNFDLSDDESDDDDFDETLGGLGWRNPFGPWKPYGGDQGGPPGPIWGV